MKKTPPGLEGRPDVTGVGSFRTARGFALRCECAFFLPATEMAKIWALVRTPSGSNGPLVLDWKFSCELTAGADQLMCRHYAGLPSQERQKPTSLSSFEAKDSLMRLPIPFPVHPTRLQSYTNGNRVDICENYCERELLILRLL
jgi:hypothetical protein